MLVTFYSFLYDYNFFAIHVINPIQTDGWRKGTEIRKRKNDTIDSVLIADLIRYGDFVETTLSNEDLYSLRNICRMRNYLFGTTSKQLLLDFSSPADFEELSVETLTETLEKLSRKKLVKVLLKSLLTLPKIHLALLSLKNNSWYWSCSWCCNYQ